MFADTGIKFDKDEYIATFMLDKVNTDTQNTLFLNTAQYTLYDATDMIVRRLRRRSMVRKMSRGISLTAMQLIRLVLVLRWTRRHAR